MRATAIMIAVLALRAIAGAAPGPGAGSAAARGGDRGNGAAARDVVESDPAGEELDLAGARVAVRGPSIGAVLAAAYTTAGLDRDPGRSWIRRARIAGLIPWLT